jgi:class 3 adenylate cyclase
MASHVVKSNEVRPEIRRRISTLLLAILTAIAGLVLVGLTVVGLRLLEVRQELGKLQDSELPRLVKLGQLSQEASAASTIAPALSATPTRFEFETLLSRLKDKEVSQRVLITELVGAFHDKKAAGALRTNGELLTGNLQRLANLVQKQIAVREKLEKHRAAFRRLLTLSLGELKPSQGHGNGDEATSRHVIKAARVFAFRILNTLIDTNRARFSRNKAEIESAIQEYARRMKAIDPGLQQNRDYQLVQARKTIDYWFANKVEITADKSAELSNEFKIKALAEESSLIANRLVSGVGNEFWRARADLEKQVEHAGETAQLTLILIVVVVFAFAAGNYLVWIVLRQRVFRRLDRMRDGLRAYAELRQHPLPDPLPDEIGEISESLTRYMAVIDERETELAAKTSTLEQLSSQLAKYLSPQVYNSIFTGKQEVRVASSRKKLTIFFSDIVDFTATADRLESEELTQLLNEYLTEMSQIALNYGATIDKYVGDAILIFFGDPESRGVKEDAVACVKMAIAMRQRLFDLEDIWRASGIEKPLQVRMGIHTGFCTVGNFGSEDRMDYTIIGSAVNVASRLETSATPGEILASYETFAHISAEVSCEETGEVRVKGISYPIATYRVGDTYENMGRDQRRFLQRHPNINLDLNLESMTKEDRLQAAKILQKGLNLLEEDTDRLRSISTPQKLS